MLPYAVTQILRSFGRTGCALVASSRSPAAAEQLLAVYSPGLLQRPFLPPPSSSLLPYLGASFSSKTTCEPSATTPSANQDPSTSAAPSGGEAGTQLGAAPTAPAPESESSSSPGSSSHLSSSGPDDAAPAPLAGAGSRRDKDAAAETVYASSKDDNLFAQRNWFNSLYTQLNTASRTGLVPCLRGRQREVFYAVEREFEGLWERHIKGKGLQGRAHHGMLLCCLAIATHKVLRYETGYDEFVNEVIQTNLGDMAVWIMTRLHKARLWLLLRLLAEDPYEQCLLLLPSLKDDQALLAASSVEVGESETTWTLRSCGFYSVLAEEDAQELMPHFCCQHSMQWLEGFSQYGVRVGLEQSLAFGDECCQVRISRRQTAADVAGTSTEGVGQQQPPQQQEAQPPQQPAEEQQKQR